MTIKSCLQEAFIYKVVEKVVILGDFLTVKIVYV